MKQQQPSGRYPIELDMDEHIRLEAAPERSWSVRIRRWLTISWPDSDQRLAICSWIVVAGLFLALISIGYWMATSNLPIEERIAGGGIHALVALVFGIFLLLLLPFVHHYARPR